MEEIQKMYKIVLNRTSVKEKQRYFVITKTKLTDISANSPAIYAVGYWTEEEPTNDNIIEVEKPEMIWIPWRKIDYVGVLVYRQNSNN